MIELVSADLRALIDPDHGACMRAFELIRPDGARSPVFAPVDPDGSDAFSSALFPMFPFANRARDNVLRIDGRDIPRKPNAHDPLAIHGFAWQFPWSVDDVTDHGCRLSLGAGCDPDFPVAFVQTFELGDGVLTISMSVENTGRIAVPMGFGWHPYFPHERGTELRFDARAFWLAGPDTLPTERLAIPPELSFSQPRPVPSTWRDNCYEGWTGTVTIRQPELGYTLEMSGSANLRHLMMFAPQWGVFALEPQSHISGRTTVAEEGLARLEPGARMESAVTFRVKAN